MAETVKKKVTPASETKKPAGEPKITEAKPVGNAGGLRALAILFWVLAIGCEVLALLFLFGQLNLIPKNPQILWIPALILDLVFVIIGSQFWKKANRIKPASKKNPTLFWLWNNMGLIACCVAFLPFVILVLSNKNLDKRTKVIATIAGAVALLIAGAASYDYNPISQEQLNAAEATITGEVYWTPYGKVYHTDMGCQALTNTETLTKGTVEEAVAANRTRLCHFCEKKLQDAGVDTSALLTDEKKDE